MIATQEKTISTARGDRRFTVSQLPAMRSIKLLTRLGKTLGPGLAALSKGEGHLDAAVRELFERLTESEVEGLIRDLLSGSTVEVDGKHIDLLKVFDIEFQGDVGGVLKIVMFALEVNFGNFLAGLAGPGALDLSATLRKSGVLST